MTSPAGTLVSSTGKIYAERGGTRVLLAEGDPFFATDTLLTSGDSTADLRFADGATARVSPDTKLVVSEFSFGGPEPTSFVLNLAQGAMRSVSGEVVRQNPDAFKIVTPQGTTGIRGTELFTSVVGGKETHAVLFVADGHVVVITANDGRSITLNGSLQMVQLTSGDMAPLNMQKFSLSEMESLVRSLADTLANNLPNPATGEDNTETPEAPAAPAHSSNVVIVALDTTAETQAAVERLQNELSHEGMQVILVDESTQDSLDSAAEDLSANTIINDKITQIFDPVEPTPDKPSTDEPGFVPIDRHYPTGIAAGSTTGLDHLNGLNPLQPQHFQVTGGMSAPLVGNALTLTSAATPLSTGSDTLTIGSLNTGASVGGVDAGLYADVVQVAMNAGQTVTLGNDTINITSMTNNSFLYGDAKSVTGTGNVVFGNDSITIGSMLGGTIYGDAPETGTASGITTSGGNDTITVTTMQDGTINAGVGDDNITISSLIGGAIYGDAGVDNITITTMSGGIVDGGAGNDIITINGAMTGGIIDGGAGSNTIAITTLQNSTIKNIDGHSSAINVTNMTSGTLVGGTGPSSYIIGNLNGNGNMITNTDGQAQITVGTLQTGSLVITLSSTTSAVDTITVGMNSSTSGSLVLNNFEAGTDRLMIGNNPNSTGTYVLNGDTLTISYTGGGGFNISILSDDFRGMTAQEAYTKLCENENASGLGTLSPPAP